MHKSIFILQTIENILIPKVLGQKDLFKTGNIKRI